MRRAIVSLLAAVGVLCACASARAADPCPNASYRTGAAAGLADCRAWEQATPTDKNGLNALTSAVPTTTTGDNAYFEGFGYVHDGDSGPVTSTNVATRGSSSWDARGADAPFDSRGSFGVARPTLDLSDDLTKALVATTRKLTPDAVEGNSNIYVRDLVHNTYRLAVTRPTSALLSDIDFDAPKKMVAENPDLTHFAFATQQKLTPDAPDGTMSGVSNLYQWDDGKLRLASVFPDGTPAVNGGDFEFRATRAPHRYSDDGRRLTMRLLNPDFTYSVYQRVDAATTKLISRSHRTGDDPSVATHTADDWSSPDGTQVTFTNNDGRPLTNESPQGDNRIYRWYADGDRLVDLLASVLPATTPAGVSRVVRVSTDGRYVWFLATTALRPGAQSFAANLYVLDTVQHRLSFAGGTADFSLLPAFNRSGTRAALLSTRSLTGYDSTSPQCAKTPGTPAPCQEVFTFDATHPSAPITCASCGAKGTTPTGNAQIGPLQSDDLGFQPHPVADDGRVFFDTPSRLLPADANALPDVYEYTPGKGLSLVSSGTGQYPATLGDVGPNGRDVFFFTADQLVGQDTDGLIDIYDARTDGGLASQRPVPPAASCSGDGCRAAPGATNLPSAGAPVTSGPVTPPTPAASYSLLTPSASARRAAARSGSLAVRVRVSAAGKLSLSARASIRGRTSKVASAVRSVASAQTLTLSLRLSSSARRELQRIGHLKLSLTGTFSSVSGHKTGSVTLARATGSSKKGASR